MDLKCAGLSAPAFRGQAPERRNQNLLFIIMNNRASTKKRHRISVDAEPGFEAKVRLLAAKWGVKTNVAIQRAVDLASARKWSEEEKTLLKTIAARTDQILELLIAA
jgi:hypothetical protein